MSLNWVEMSSDQFLISNSTSSTYKWESIITIIIAKIIKYFRVKARDSSGLKIFRKMLYFMGN